MNSDKGERHLQLSDGQQHEKKNQRDEADPRQEEQEHEDENDQSSAGCNGLRHVAAGTFIDNLPRSRRVFRMAFFHSVRFSVSPFSVSPACHREQQGETEGCLPLFGTASSFLFLLRWKGFPFPWKQAGNRWRRKTSWLSHPVLCTGGRGRPRTCHRPSEPSR